MKTIDQLYQDLDIVLKHLNNHDDDGFYTNQFELQKEIGYEFSTLHIYHLCEKLHKDGFVSISYEFSWSKPTKDNPNSEKNQDYDKPMFLINYQGKEFFLKGGYNEKRKEETLNKYWLIIKTVAAVLNALAIVIISVISLFISNENRDLKKEISEKEQLIKNLQSDRSD